VTIQNVHKKSRFKAPPQIGTLISVTGWYPRVQRCARGLTERFLCCFNKVYEYNLKLLHMNK